MATIWPAPGAGGGATAEENLVAEAVDAMVSYQ